MKILSGIYKNTPLNSPKTSKTHPMGSREKLALFNMLMPYLKQATVLDAFAGSGALGLEALSRQAKQVVFLEKSPKIAQIIYQNLNTIKQTASVIIKPAEKFHSPYTFDIIIADPPYNDFRPEIIIHLSKYLQPNGILALSHPKSAPNFPHLQLLKTHHYASAHLSLYQKI